MTLFFPMGVQSGSELLASCARVEVRVNFSAFCRTL